VMSPKSLLRHPAAVSSVEDFTRGRFQHVIPDTTVDPKGVQRILLCSGKVYYDLIAEAEKVQEGRPAIVRLEQLYSFPWVEVRAVLGRYPRMEELVWVQEEPRNMGAWSYMAPKLQELAPEGVMVGYVGRPERASPAEGYPAAHAEEQSRIVQDALAAGRLQPVLPTLAAAGEAKG